MPAALAAWRRLLAPGGRLAFSEAVWLTDTPAPRARALFAGYPAMTDVAGVRRVDRRGRLAARRRLPRVRAAWDNYYGPLAARLGRARAPQHGPAPAFDEAREEIAVRRAHGGDYGYAFFVAVAVTDAAVAALVERGDPDRWRAAMTAPPAARPGLMALYAFNLEIARAPWAASEPMLARDPAAAGGWTRSPRSTTGAPPRRHEVVEPLAAAIAAPTCRGGCSRRWSRRGSPTPRRRRFADRAALELYIDHTAGHLMELAARHLGAEGAALPVVRDFARGAGTAALLRALPELRARGRDPLPPGLAVGGAGARRARGASPARAAAATGCRGRRRPRCSPAGRPAAVLRRAAADPGRGRGPAGSRAPRPPRAASLLWRAFSGRW